MREPSRRDNSLHRHLQKRIISFVSTFPLCLSRACLGKMIVFSMKTAHRDAFSVPYPSACKALQNIATTARDARRYTEREQTAFLFLSFYDLPRQVRDKQAMVCQDRFGTHSRNLRRRGRKTDRQFSLCLFVTCRAVQVLGGAAHRDATDHSCRQNSKHVREEKPNVVFLVRVFGRVCVVGLSRACLGKRSCLFIQSVALAGLERGGVDLIELLALTP